MTGKRMRGGGVLAWRDACQRSGRKASASQMHRMKYGLIDPGRWLGYRHGTSRFSCGGRRTKFPKIEAEPLQME